jgi:hypothetical protein
VVTCGGATSVCAIAALGIRAAISSSNRKALRKLLPFMQIAPIGSRPT